MFKGKTEAQMEEYFQSRLSGFTILNRRNPRNVLVDFNSVLVQFTFDGWCGRNEVTWAILDGEDYDSVQLASGTGCIEEWSAMILAIHSWLPRLDARRATLFKEAFSKINNTLEEDLAKERARAERRVEEFHYYADLVSTLPDKVADMGPAHRSYFQFLGRDAQLRAFKDDQWRRAFARFPTDAKLTERREAEEAFRAAYLAFERATKRLARAAGRL